MGRERQVQDCAGSRPYSRGVDARPPHQV